MNFILMRGNLRLGRHQTNTNLSQQDILDMMSDWHLDELAESYLENGFWQHEALLVVEEELEEEPCLVVIDGNRRLAALIYLHQAISGEPISEKWNLLVENREVPAKLFNEIPYVQINSRQEVEAFLGFHHSATSIKKWFPEQKAEYIAKLIDEKGMSYEEVVRTIGISTSTVQYYYISYRLLLQIIDCLRDFSVENIGLRFGTLFFSLQTLGVQKYLGLDIFAEPDDARTPIPKNRLEAPREFCAMVIWYSTASTPFDRFTKCC